MMFSLFGRKLTLAICIALPLTASLVCPCQLGARSGSAVAASEKNDHTENKECCLCRVAADARYVYQSLSEQDVRLTAILPATKILVSSRTVARRVTSLTLADLPVLDLLEIQVFLE